MKKFFLILIGFVAVPWMYGQSTIVIGNGSSVSVGTGSAVTAGYRDGTMLNNGTFNSRSIVLNPVTTAATSVNQSSFSANWNVAAGATGYKLDVSTDINYGSFITGYSNIDVGNVLTYNVNTNLSAATVYYYRVRAYDIDGITGYSNTTTLTTAPLVPVASAASTIIESGFSANWGASAGAVKYYLDVSTNSGFNAGSFVPNFENKDVENVTTYSVTGLSENITYYYRVRSASSSGGTSTSSNTITVLTAPLPPVATAATALTQTSFSANWNAAAGATKYYIDVSTVNTFASFVTGWNNTDVNNVTTYSINTNINSGTTYYLRVRSSNGAGISTNSNTITILTIPPNPVATAAAVITQTSFSANWNASVTATKYYVDVAADNLFTVPVAAWTNVDMGNVTTFSVNTDLAGGTTYYYRIRSENASGTSGNSNVISVLTIPPNPVTTAATTITQTSFDANWNASSSATKYFLDVATDIGFSNFVTGRNNLDVGIVTAYSITTNLTSGTTYYYRVRALNANGTSGNSNTTSVVLVPPNPTAIVATNIGQTSFNANWNAANGATKYYLDVATDNGFTDIVAAWGDLDVGNVVTKSVNSNLTAATTYYYRVRAFNTNGLTGNSNTITLITAPSAPVANAGSNTATNSFSANWNAAATAIGYLIDVSTDINFGAGTFVTGYNGKDIGNVLTYSVSSNLFPGTTYYYRVRAYNAYGTGTNSNTITYGTKPVNPIAAAATSITFTSFSANWNTVSGATGYKLDVSTDINFGTFVGIYNDFDVTNLLTRSVTLLNPNTTYYYRVRAYNDYGTGGNSGTVTTLTAPVAPVADAASAIGPTDFTANWQATAGVTGYYLDVSTASNFSSFITGFNSKDVGNVITYLVPSLSRGTTYYYRVRGFNSGGTGPSSNDQTVITQPAPPAVSAASGITATAFDANWSASTSATGYRLDVSTDASFGAGNYVADFQDKDVGNVLTDNVTGLAAGNTYYYRLRAYNGNGTDGNSSFVTVITIPPAPADQAASSITSNSFVANWTGVSGAIGYLLDVATDNGFSALVNGFHDYDVSGSVSFSITDLSPSTVYYYRIRAYNATGISNYSNTRNCTTDAAAGTVTARPASVIAGSSFQANWDAFGGATGYKIDVSTVPDFASFVGAYHDYDAGANINQSVSGLSEGNTYYYRVIAYDGGGSIGTSGTITVRTVLNLPSVPTTNSGSLIGETNFTSNWNSSSGATGYFLDVATNSGFTTFVTGFNNKYVGNVTTYLVTGLSGGNTYYYQIRAKNGSGTSASSGSETVITLPPEPPIFSASLIQGTSFSANWGAANGATGYRLDVSTVSDFGTTLVNYTNKNVNDVVTYPVSGLTTNTNYYYRVKGYNANGTGYNSVTVLVTTGPTAPVATAATSPEESTIIANWNTSAGADGYRLDVSTRSDFASFIAGFNNKDVGNVTAYTVTGLIGGATYYYRVRAYIGGRESDNSNSITLLTKPPAPVATAATSVSSTSFSANWNSSNGATKYYLEVSTLSNFSTYVTGFDPKDALAAITYSVTSLNPNTIYYYRVSANNDSGTGTVSNIISVLTAPAAPTANAATSITNVSFNANWSSSTGANGYYLDVATDAGFTNKLFGYDNQDVGNVLTYSVSSLNGSTQYFYQVRAYNSGGTSGYSGTQNPTTLINPSGVPVPTAATSLAETSFITNWGAVAGAAGYRLDVSTDINFGAGNFISGYEDLDVLNVTNFLVNSNILGGRTYYYRLRSYNISGTSSNSAKITVLTVPASPVSSIASVLAVNSFTANWNSVTGATKYFLDVSTASGFTAGTFVTGFQDRDVNNVTSYSVSGLSGGTTYYYRIRAFNASGTSGNSGFQTALTILAAPMATSATSITQTAFTANWNSSNSATTYFLDVSTDAAFGAGTFVSGFQNRDVGNVLTYPLTGLSSNSSYYYRVRALNASGTSSNSNIITAIGIPSATSATSITLNSFSANWNVVSGATSYRLDVSSDSNFASFVADWNDVNIAGGGVTTKAVNTNLSANTKYYYRIRSNDGSVTSVNSNRITITTAPVSPAATAATTITQSSFIANWNIPAGGASGYRLDVSSDINFVSGNFVEGYENLDVSNVTVDTVNTNILSGTNYYYRVRAYSASAASTNSNTITLLTKMSPPSTRPPSNITQTSFDANWDVSTGATKYYLDVATDFGFTSFLPAYNNVDVGNVLTYSVSGLSANSNYYYRLRAFNASETTASSNGEYCKTNALAPVSEKATYITNTGFKANWIPQGVSSGGYLLDVASDVAFSNFLDGYQAKGIAGATVADVNANMTSGNPFFFYRVRAYSPFGESSNSNIICAAKQPTCIQFIHLGCTSFSVNFTASQSGGNYIIVRGNGNSPVFVPVDGNNYVVGAQGADNIVYIGHETSFVENNITTTNALYYKVYSFHQTASGNFYVLDSPLTGTNQLLAGTNPTGVVPPTANPTTTLFPDLGVSVSFTNGCAGTTITAKKENSVPAAGIGLSNSGVNQLEPLYFTLHSTNAAAGTYSIVLDFSSLGYTDWSTFKVLKRIDENSIWQDITLSPYNAVITNRETDGIPGKFTITGLASFSHFAIGRFVNIAIPMSIKILSPQNGERWQAGTIQTIVWQRTGPIAGVKIEYSTDEGSSWNLILDQILVGLTYYNWNVPSGFNSDKCKIRISNWYNPNIYDVSLGTFTIYDLNISSQILGDVNKDGLVTAYDASLVLQFIVGNITFTDTQRSAADINGDGIIDATDALRILYYCIKGSWSMNKSMSVSGKIITGEIILDDAGKFILPLKAMNLAGANSIEINFDLGNNLVNTVEYENLISKEWMIASNLNNGKFIIAMAGLEALENGLMGNLKIRFKDSKLINPISMEIKINSKEIQKSEIDLKKYLPVEFMLSQNYPNPFNPTTSIRFALPQQSIVKIIVYDAIGREIKKLLDSEKTPGYYTVTFEAENIPSGVYIYQIITSGFKQARKMLLLK